MQTMKIIVLVLILLVLLYIAREMKRKRMAESTKVSTTTPTTVVFAENPKSNGMSGYVRGLQDEITGSVSGFFGNPRETSYIG